MKLTLCSAIALSLIFTSCSSLDPEYADYKKQKEAEAAAGAQSPYGQPAADPYGVPGSDTAGNYAPYQPLPGTNDPGVPGAPEPIQPLGASTPGPAPYLGIPSTPPAAPLGRTLPHTVVKGDSIWGLAKRYGTSQDAIRAANGLSSDTIQIGRTLQIPSNN